MEKKIIVTGGWGFVGSNVVRLLNSKGIRPAVTLRGYGSWRNVAGLSFDLMDTPFGHIDTNTIVVHLGANVRTDEPMDEGLWDNNVEYSLDLAAQCRNWDAKFIYASSASVYGNSGDFTERIDGLSPLNAYAQTKLMVDNKLFWSNTPPKTYGLRLFNVFGNGEAHKGGMASPIYKGLNKVEPLYRAVIRPSDRPHSEAYWSLFKGDRPISRDFVFAEDVAKVIYHFITKDDIPSGLFNVGSGVSTTFEDVVRAIDSALPIHYTPIPENLRAGYQYFSQANLNRLRVIANYQEPFKTVPEAIAIMRNAK